MSALQIQPSVLQGVVRLPASKSHTMRAMLFAALAQGESIIQNYLPSPDTRAMALAIRQMGAKALFKKDAIHVFGVASEMTTPDDIIHCGNSGQVLRFVSAILALQSGHAVLTGDESIKHLRPMSALLSGLRQLGAECFSLKRDEKAPVIIKGPIKSGKVQMQGHDSQPVSALLIAATQMHGTTEIQVDNIGELPWVRLTLSWLKRMGCQYTVLSDGHYMVTGPTSISGFKVNIPGDLSSLAYPVVASLITRSPLFVDDVDLTDCQGDKLILDYLRQMGARFDYEPDKKRLWVKRCEQLRGGAFDMNPCIDAITIMAVCASYASTPTRLYNAKIAREKECDRLAAICQMLNRMGGKVTEFDDGLLIEPSTLAGAECQTFADHRIALSLAVAALAAKGETRLLNVECMNKSYPGFVESMQGVRAQMHLCESELVI